MEPCNQKIFQEGTPIFIGHTVSSVHMEQWVKSIAEQSGQLVDWHQCGGRAVILALGDLDKVKKAIVKNQSQYNNFYREAVLELKNHIFNENYIKQGYDGIWEYNFKYHDLYSYMCSKCKGRCNPQNHSGWSPE